MAETRREGRGAAGETENSAETAADTTARQGVGDAARQQTERLAAQASEGVLQADAVSAAGAEAALRSGSATAQGVQDIAAAWTRYAEEVMRQTRRPAGH